MLKIDLSGKRALVTGGNSGIGMAIARALAEAGAAVAINYVTHPEAAEALRVELTAKGAKAIALEADISKQDQVASMFRNMDSALGGIDILINNAGIDGETALGWDADTSAWQRVIEINLFGTFFCAREALQRMIPTGAGVVLNISSVHEEIAWTGHSAYTASKAAVSMLTKTIAQEAAPHGIRVLALAPGAVKTPINKSVWSDPNSMRDLLTKIPLGRIGMPEEIANMAAVLVSDAASYITGRTVFVDGGMTDFPNFAHGG